MKRIIGSLLLGLIVLGGCASPAEPPGVADAAPGNAAPAPHRADKVAPAPAPAAGGAARADTHSQVLSAYADDDQPVAQVGGRVITMRQFLAPLIESHGLNTLLHLVQLELAKLKAAERNIQVADADVAAERDRTLGRLFENADEKTLEKIEQAKKENKPDEVKRLEREMEEEHDQLLNQFLTQQNITRGEFDLLMQTNAHLRKMAEPKLQGKITDDMLRKEFGVQYNEKVRVRHIQFDRREDVQVAKQRLGAGEDFGTLAADMSVNKQTAVLKGELPPFTRDDQRLPQNFKDVAFALKPGEVSDLVEADNTYHVIKLEERIGPRGMKFEQVKDTLYKDLHERLTLALMKQAREEIGEIARKELRINHPVIKKEWDQRMTIRASEVASQKKALEAEAERQRARIEAVRERLKLAATRPAGTQPAGTQPAGTHTGPAAPATQPASTPAGSLKPVGAGAPPPAPEAPARPPTTAPAKG